MSEYIPVVRPLSVVDGTGILAFRHRITVKNLAETPVDCPCTWAYLRGVRTLKFASRLCTTHGKYTWSGGGQ